MRVVAINVFLYPLFSYLGRVALLPQSIVRLLADRVLRWLTPVPFTKLQLLSHLKSFFGCSVTLRDLQLDNVAALLSTAWGLHEKGLQAHVITGQSLHGRCVTDMLCPGNQIAFAYSFFHRLVGRTPDYILQRGK